MPEDRVRRWRNFRRSLWVWAFSIFLLVAIPFLVTSTYAFNQCVREHKNDKTYEQLKQRVSFIDEPTLFVSRVSVRARLTLSCAVDEKNSGTLLAILTGLLVIFTARLWVSTSRLWSAAVEHAGHAERAIKVTEDTAERQLRAYVWVKATELHDLQPGAFPWVKVEIRNAGQTPAYDMLVSAGCLAMSYPLPQNTPFPTIRHARATRMVLHPGTDPPFEAIAGTRPAMNLPNGLLLQQVQALIQGRQMRLFVFVLVTYRDAFNKQRETRFCVSVDATAGIAGVSPYPITFEHCDQHNSAT